MSVKNENTNSSVNKTPENVTKKKKKAKVKVFNKKKRGSPENEVIKQLQEKYDSVSTSYIFSNFCSLRYVTLDRPKSNPNIC